MNKEKYIQENKELWAKEVTTGRLFYPDENVVRFLVARKNEKSEKNKVALDFGCGAGRHSVVMLNMGYDVIAMDYNKECLEATKERVKEVLEEKDKRKRFIAIQNNGVALELESNSVDDIVAWGSIFYTGRETLKAVLCEMRRVLQKDGELFFDIRTQRDAMYGQGEELEKDFFRLDTPGYEGFTYLFLTKEEIQEILETCGFEVANVETYEFTKNNGKKLNSWYHITAKKRI